MTDEDFVDAIGCDELSNKTGTGNTGILENCGLI